MYKKLCQQCGHEWYGPQPHPKQCPNRRCSSPYWDSPDRLLQHICLRCHHQWHSRTVAPKKCSNPNCQTKLWARKKVTRYGNIS